MKILIVLSLMMAGDLSLAHQTSYEVVCETTQKINGDEDNTLRFQEVKEKLNTHLASLDERMISSVSAPSLTTDGLYTAICVTIKYH